MCIYLRNIINIVVITWKSQYLGQMHAALRETAFLAMALIRNDSRSLFTISCLHLSLDAAILSYALDSCIWIKNWPNLTPPFVCWLQLLCLLHLIILFVHIKIKIIFNFFPLFRLCLTFLFVFSFAASAQLLRLSMGSSRSFFFPCFFPLAHSLLFPSTHSIGSLVFIFFFFESLNSQFVFILFHWFFTIYTFFSANFSVH